MYERKNSILGMIFDKLQVHVHISIRFHKSSGEKLSFPKKRKNYIKNNEWESKIGNIKN